jgi:hypothetical protein
MDEAGTACAALAETTVFLSYFKDMPDHRQRGKVIYPLDEILLLCLLAVRLRSMAPRVMRHRDRPSQPLGTVSLCRFHQNIHQGLFGLDRRTYCRSGKTEA